MERQKSALKVKQQGVHLSRAAITRLGKRILLATCLVILSILLSATWPASPLLSTALAEPKAPEIVDPAVDAAAESIVERWHGTVHEETTSTNSYADCPWICYGDDHRLEREEWELEVHEDGYVRGYIKTELVDYSYKQTKTNNGCGPVAETNYTINECKYAGQVTQPNSEIFVEGKRELDPYSQKPVLRLTQRIIIEECEAVWTARGIHSNTGAEVHKQEDDNCSRPLYVPRTYQIVTYEDGRAPQILMNDSHGYSGSSTVRWGHLTGSTEEPFLELDRELLERSIFLDQVPVEELFTANMNWNSPDGGWVTWEFAEQAPERVGPTHESEIPKPINAGNQGVGRKQLTVQAKSTLNKTSDPETTQVTVAKPPAWTGAPSQISATKVSGAVTYKSSFKFPEPAFKGDVTVWAIVPFLGGKTLGLTETQGSLTWEAQSTSEGQGSLSGQTGFKAMGRAVIGSLTGRAKIILGTEGVQIPEGGMDFGIAGTIASDPEPLLKVVPSLRPALLAIEKISSRASNFINERAQVKLELQPKLDFGFNFFTQNDEIKFKEAEAKPGFGFKTMLELNLIKGVLQATASIGGAISATFKVPEPYFKEAAIQGLIQAQIILYRFVWEGEKAWSVVMSGGAAAAGIGNDQAWESNSASGSWQLMDRSYLDAPDYAQWLGDSPVAQSVMEEGADIRLIRNISPLANTSLDAWTNSFGSTRLVQAWVHDEPTFPALSSGEIKFSRNYGTSWQTPAYLTNDTHDDLAPKVVHLSANNDVMVLWQRMDTPTPPDFNDDPAGYLSHWQIAARLTNRYLPLQQLSTSGSLNYRHQLGATDDGALAVWVNNPANQLIGDTTNPDHILFSHYKIVGSSWTTATTIIPNVTGLLDLDLATNGQFGALVYSRDIDGDLATVADQDLFYITWNGSVWSAPARLTNNSVADESPQLVLNESGAPSLVWRQNGALKFLNGGWNGTPVALALAGAAERTDYELERSADGNLALIWQEVGPEDTRVGYAIYDATHSRWSDQLTLTPPEQSGTDGSATSMATGITAALVPADDDEEGDNGKLVVTYQLAHVENVTRTVQAETPEGIKTITIPNVPQIGQHDLHYAELPLRVNLSVAPTDLSAPSADTIQAVIHNRGEVAVNNAPIVLHVGAGDPVSGATQRITQTLPLIAAGSATTVTFSIANRSETIFVVEIDPERTLTESDISDNSATLGTDLSVTSLPAYYSPLGITIRALVSQHSPRYVSLVAPFSLTLEGSDEPVIGGGQVGFPLTPTTSIAVSAFVSPTHLGAGRHHLYWTVDPQATVGEHNQSNNVIGTTIMVLPDLAVENDVVNFGTAPGTTAPFQVSVQNLGNWPNDGGFLEVFDGQPGKSGTHSLLKLPLPAIEPGESAELAGVLQLAGLPAASSGLSSIYIQLDPEGLVDESNENNNLTASGAVLETGTDDSGFPLYLPTIQR